ncbi:MAG: hypothetical protein JNM17_21910 [Archangium sp.]|nr:hypothetical protein [Archangium sp.]
MDSTNRISMTPTVARQTPKNEFGNVLKNTLQTAVTAGSQLVGMLPGAGIVSAAVSNVTALTGGSNGTAQGISAATGIASVGGGGSATAQTLASSPAGGVPGEMGGMISQMRAEADRSMLVQMQMQQESREYNTLSNVLKVRHDSAKSAINNIR